MAIPCSGTGAFRGVARVKPRQLNHRLLRMISKRVVIRCPLSAPTHVPFSAPAIISPCQPHAICRYATNMQLKSQVNTRVTTGASLWCRPTSPQSESQKQHQWTNTALLCRLRSRAMWLGNWSVSLITDVRESTDHWKKRERERALIGYPDCHVQVCFCCFPFSPFLLFGKRLCSCVLSLSFYWNYLIEK